MIPNPRMSNPNSRKILLISSLEVAAGTTKAWTWCTAPGITPEFCQVRAGSSSSASQEESRKPLPEVA